MTQHAAEKESVSQKSLRARKARRDLIASLGGKCATCPRTENLHCDCIIPQGCAHHFMPWPQRVRFYWQEHLKGNLQLLCPRCHIRKTTLENHKARGVRSIPQSPDGI